ncbi:hypothetical protein quinque_008931 [Culex quinquefasciatus]
MPKSFGIKVAKLANFPTAVVELAQKLYDDCEDHYSQMQIENDQEGIKVFLESLAKISGVDAENEKSIGDMLGDIRLSVVSSNSAYFRRTFPQLYV